MPTLSSFTFLTLNGYFKGLGGDTSWHRHGAEEAQFSADSMKTGNTLLFGRVTYEMMAGFWPTEMAAQMFPDVAKGMNAAKKIVFSNSMKKANWQNTTVIGGNIVNAVRKLKEASGDDLTILGSGSIVATLADACLIDTFGIMIDPVALPQGTAIFNGITKKLDLKLTNSRAFKSGVVLLTYEKQ